MKINKSRKFKKGFSLVEMLAVLSILIVLISFIVPKINSYRKKAEDVKIKGAANQIYNACMVSYSENNGKFEPKAVSSTIKDTIGLDIAEGDIIVDSDNLTVSCQFDGKNYTVTIDGGKSTYDVKQKDDVKQDT